MKVEIIDEPIQFRLHGIGGVVKNEHCSVVGLRLMDEMWRVVKGAKIPNTGINHWVYLPGDKMFVGVELRTPHPVPLPDTLEPLDVELTRYLRHLHIGPYQELPQKWQALKAELATRGETIRAPSLEVYGHQPCDDTIPPETTILIGLRAKS